jgi:hypothetical protein
MVYVGVDLHRKRSHIVALDPTARMMVEAPVSPA